MMKTFRTSDNDLYDLYDLYDLFPTTAHDLDLLGQIDS